MVEIPSSPEEFLARHGSALYTTAYRVCLRHDLAEEAAAAAAHAAWRRMSGFSGRSSFKTWLTRIALNAAIDALRRERAQAPAGRATLEDALERPDKSRDSAPSRVAEEEDRDRRIGRALAAMDEPHRCVLVLREWERLSYKEIAETLDCPIGTVMSRLSHARRIFRDIYGPEDE